MVVQVLQYLVYNGEAILIQKIKELELFRGDHRNHRKELTKLYNASQQDWVKKLKQHKLRTVTQYTKLIPQKYRAFPNDFNICYQVKIKGAWTESDGETHSMVTYLFPTHPVTRKPLLVQKYGFIEKPQ